VWHMDSPAPEPPVFGASTFGILGIQLALTISRTVVVVCSNCQTRYMREGRAPQVGRRNFCGDCRSATVDPGRAIRLRAMRHRDNRILELVDAGLAKRAAAKRLGETPERVRDAVRRRASRRGVRGVVSSPRVRS
jgi:hypothetical protein